MAESTVEPPALPHTPAISVTETFHRSPPRERIAKNIPMMEEEPPSLPPPSSSQPLRGKDLERPPWQAPQDDFAKTATQQAAGETYGTQVFFHNNQGAAADLARREHKLLFVMHIAGNFEDSCFT